MPRYNISAWDGADGVELTAAEVSVLRRLSIYCEPSTLPEEIDELNDNPRPTLKRGTLTDAILRGSIYSTPTRSRSVQWVRVDNLRQSRITPIPPWMDEPLTHNQIAELAVLQTGIETQRDEAIKAEQRPRLDIDLTLELDEP